MRLIAAGSALLATLPILVLNASPKANEEILAVFNTETPPEELLSRTARLGLDVLRYDASIGHMTVQDHDGSSASTLYGLGARMVIDADLFSACQSSPAQPT